jgi:hypothetical protein
MNQALIAEIARLGGDPTDEVWHWFLLTGPHGSSLTWSQTRSEPPGYVGIEHLQRIVTEKAQLDPSFISRAVQVTEQALSSTEPNFLRRAVQVAAVIGAEPELQRVSALTSHSDASVSAHARASVFHLKMRLRLRAAT